MTVITIIRSTDGEYREMICEGHAGFAQAGSDIVCSAVSVLVINTVNSLEKLTDTQMETVSDRKRGLIRCRFTGGPDAGGRLLLDSMVLGLQSVAEQYGKKFLRLKFKEV